MRAGIIVTLLVCGCLLVAAPMVVETIVQVNHQANVVRLLEKPGTQNVTLQKVHISDYAEFGSWAVGVLLLLTAVYLILKGSDGALRRRKEPPPMPEN